jgi:hypothetical protein
VNRRCVTQRSGRGGDSEIRISVEVFVGPHRLVHLTAGRVLMIVLEELQDDRVPIHLVRVGLSGADISQPGDCP